MSFVDSPATDTEIRIPFEYAPPLAKHLAPMASALLVKIRVDGSKLLPVMLDTGFTGTVLLFRNAARRCGLRGRKTTSQLDTKGNRYVKCAVDNVVILCNERHTARLPVRTVSYPKRDPFGPTNYREGLLGLAAIQHERIGIDFDKRVITLDDMAVISDGAISLPLFRHAPRGHFYVKAVLADGIEADFVIDTGSEASHIPESLAQKVRSIGRAEGFVQSLSGWDRRTTLLLPYLKIGEFIENDVAFSVAPDTDHCILGLNVLSRFIVTMDFPNRRLILARSPSYAERVQVTGTTGLSIMRRRGLFSRPRYVVSHVRSGSPAAGAGIRSGDRLVAVDNHRVSRLAEHDVKQLLRGPAGGEAILSLKRQHKPLTIPVIRQSIYRDDD